MSSAYEGLRDLARGFCESPGSREAAFDLVVDLDNEMKKIFDQTPVWMKDKTLQSVPSAPNWLDWQKDVFKVSLASFRLLSGSHIDRYQLLTR